MGFLLCMPYRLVPRYILTKALAPPIGTDRDGRAKLAPYALRKIAVSYTHLTLPTTERV